MSVLEVRNLTKQFGPASNPFVAVNNISFSIAEGEIVGFLGPNGAGKTTTIQMLLGITEQTSGTLYYFGKNFATHKQSILQRINFTSAFNTLQGRITVWENLYVFAHLYSVPRPEEKIRQLISHFKAEDFAHKRYHDLSAGQKTRVNFIKALMNDPAVILMDEPTASLDPDIADTTLTFIEELRKERSLTILYTSHNMSEVTRICDRVIFLDQGTIVAEDTPLGLTKRISDTSVKLTYDEGKQLIEDYAKEQNLQYSFPTSHTVIIHQSEKTIPKTIFGISKKGVWVTDIEVIKPTLEDVFLHIARRK